MKKDNELITEFMGIKPSGFIRGDDLDPRYKKGEYVQTGWGGMHPKEMQYHTSFDWFMPAWYKFRDLAFDLNQVEIRKDHALHIQAIAYSISHEDLPKAHKRLIYGIKWYNQQKP